jgi:hypothetical protein
VLHAFVYNDVAVLVRHWFEVSLQDSHFEHGTRVELRVRTPEPQRGSESAAQRITIDQPLWRADLFDRVDGERGGFEAAHFHPRFDGPEPCERNWRDVVKATPWEWLDGCLADMAAVAADAGASVTTEDAEQIRADAPMIVAAARARAADQCSSKEQCYAWTQDAAPIVHLMLSLLQRPELLDRDRISPWLESQPA